MSNLWERFDSIASKDEVETAKAQFSPLPAGEYAVVLESVEAAESKDGLPMLKAKLRVVENNRVIFHNQMLQSLNYPNMTAVNIAEAIDFLSKVTGQDVEFEGLGKLAQFISEVPVGGEYKVKVSYGKNDLDQKFPKVKVLAAEVSVETMDFTAAIGDDDMPF